MLEIIFRWRNIGAQLYLFIQDFNVSMCVFANQRKKRLFLSKHRSHPEGDRQLTRDSWPMRKDNGRVGCSGACSNPSTWKAEAGGFATSMRPAWSAQPTLGLSEFPSKLTKCSMGWTQCYLPTCYSQAVGAGAEGLWIQKQCELHSNK